MAEYSRIVPEPGKKQFDVKLMLLGFLVALFSTGIGIGGGMLFVSLLVSVFGYDFKRAAGVSLATIIPISLTGALSHFLLLKECMHPEYYAVFIPACVLGTVLGAKKAAAGNSGRLKIVFALFLGAISLKMLQLIDVPAMVYHGLDGIPEGSEWMLLVPVGIVTGMTAVALGIGCGLLIVPFFVIVMDLGMHQAIPLSLSTMFFLSLSATVIRKKLKTLDTVPLKSMLVPALCGAVCGALLSSRLPAPLLKKMFGLFLFVIAGNYIVRGTVLRLKPAVASAE